MHTQFRQQRHSALFLPPSQSRSYVQQVVGKEGQPWQNRFLPPRHGKKNTEDVALARHS